MNWNIWENISFNLGLHLTTVSLENYKAHGLEFLHLLHILFGIVYLGTARLSCNPGKIQTYLNSFWKPWNPPSLSPPEASVKMSTSLSFGVQSMAASEKGIFRFSTSKLAHLFRTAKSHLWTNRFANTSGPCSSVGPCMAYSGGVTRFREVSRKTPNGNAFPALSGWLPIPTRHLMGDSGLGRRV